MKQTISIMFLLLFIGPDSRLLDQASRLFEQQAYPASIETYQEALKIYPEERPAILFNIAQAYWQMDSVSLALHNFHRALKPQLPQLAAHASNNIGVILVGQQQFQQALSAFKDALIYDETNEAARFNYELLLRRLQSSSNNPPPNDDQPDSSANDRQQNPPQTNRRSNTSSSRSWFRRSPNSENAGAIMMDTIPIARAQQLLEEMRKNELKFLQQLRKIPANPLLRKEKRKDW